MTKIFTPKQIIFPEDSLRDAMAQLTLLSQNILAVVNDNYELQGVLTDGDIRRALLGGASTEEKVSNIFNKNAVTGKINKNPYELKKLMREQKIDRLPVVDQFGVFLRFEFLEREFISNAVPNFSGDEMQSISEAINSNFIAVGPKISDFEQEICSFTGSKHAIATNSGTSALHLSLIAAGVVENNIVITSTFSFAATANVIRYVNAIPKFVDIDEETLCICVESVKNYLSSECVFDGRVTIEKKTGFVVKALMPVHVYGHPADLNSLRKLAEDYALAIVEDAAEALGARYGDEMIGEKSYLCGLSFNGNKIITTGAGGMVLTNSDEVACNVRHYANQCKRDGSLFLHDAVGYNYRMPNINAAIGCAQAKKLPEFLEAKRKIAAVYKEELFSIVGTSMVWEQHGAHSSFWMPIFRIDRQHHKFKIDTLLNFLISRGVGARGVWFPLHRQKAFKQYSSGSNKLADEIFDTSICLPCSTNMSEQDQILIINEIRSFFSLPSDDLE